MVLPHGMEVLSSLYPSQQAVSQDFTQPSFLGLSFGNELPRPSVQF